MDNDAAISPDYENFRHAADAGGLQTYVVVLPSIWIATGDINLPDVPHGTVFATEIWVERCIFLRRFLDPTSDVLSRSFYGLQKDCMFAKHTRRFPSVYG